MHGFTGFAGFTGFTRVYRDYLVCRAYFMCTKHCTSLPPKSPKEVICRMIFGGTSAPEPPSKNPKHSRPPKTP